MKRLVVVTMVAGILAVALVGTALAADPTPTPTPCPISSRVPGTGYGPGGGLGFHRGMPVWAGLPDAVEQLLGMTDAQIRAERLAGKSLAQIAQGKGVDEQTLITTILDAKKAELDRLVADGKLTQDQAAIMYQHMQQQVPIMVTRTAVGPVFGHGQGTPPAGSPGRSGRSFGPRWATP